MFKKYKNLNLTTGVSSSLIFICFTAFALFIFLSFALTVIAEESTGCQNHSITGVAWSDNVGWISLTCRNENQVGEGIDYGIDIDEGGVFSGHAWSENIGWISFSEEDLEGCPEGDCIAGVNESNDLYGWAKALSNDEWISLSGEIDEEVYKVSMMATDSELFGWAWGGGVIGWITFSEGIGGEDGGWPVMPELTEPGTEGSYISLLNSDFPIDEFENVTFSAWIYWEGLSGQNASGIYGLINENASTVIHFEITNGDGDLRLKLNSNDQTASGAVRKNKWTHVAFSYNHRTKRADIYVNGEKVSSKTNDAGTLKVSPKRFHAIGRSDDSTPRNFTGTMSAVRIYDGVIPD